MTTRVVAAVVAAATLALGCGSEEPAAGSGDLAGVLGDAEPAAAPFDGHTAAEVAVGDRVVSVVVADEADERSAGLRGRTDPAPYDGMLFVADGDSTSAFTMRGVSEPLELALYDADGRRIGGHELEPCPDARDCPSYPAERPWRYALETPPGMLPDGALGAPGAS